MTEPATLEAVPSATAAPPRGRRRGVALLLVLAATVAGFAAWQLVTPATDTVALQIWHQRDEVVLYERTVDLESSFVLEHTHSVTRRPVRETFSVQRGPIIAIEELWFDEPGPNLPSGSEPLGDGRTTFLHEGRTFRVLHHGYPIGAVPLLVGSDEVGHVLKFEDGEVRLLDVAPRGAPVELRVSPNGMTPEGRLVGRRDDEEAVTGGSPARG